jgi:3'(2'), 5'-bisphosphate nucleotidase
VATTNSFSGELEIATKLAREAGDVAVKIRDRGALGVELKLGDEPVTLADRAASELIVAGLAAAFPADPIISEESPVPAGALASHRHWFVDPIDGTKDFIRGSDGFSVMIGLVEGGRPVLGVVHQPTTGRTFFTADGAAWMDFEGERTRLAVSDVSDAAAARLVASASHRSPEIDRVKATLGISDEHNIGSVGVKLALIAMGLRDLYINPQPKTKAWDTCAPEAILVAAGGRLTDLFGAPIEYTGALGHPRGLVASNGLVHDAVIAKIAPLFAALRT